MARPADVVVGFGARDREAADEAKGLCDRVGITQR